jgi:lipopolysaccharide export system protein LptA
MVSPTPSRTPMSIRQRLGLVAIVVSTVVSSSLLSGFGANPAFAQTKSALRMTANVQEANSKTGVVTARGNVQIDYPARQIKATASQAQYFRNERRIVLTGNVYVTQAGGNTLQGEVITYLIDEGRFIATPRPAQQVQSTYVIDGEKP